ncbi:unnamed protein product [Prorocentrum cordatum]|uniref:Uncharacterized protein n=1 Tax=Prorocentrum cordatum TaxID=2364126 RepID=A0ABN9U2X2_9DINO|nr:unnamed protein product [Polarella glacialis]
MPPTSGDGARPAALEVARGALLALHSAAGLTTGSAEMVEARRLLRAAEGMVRAAVALLAKPQPPALDAAAGAAPPAAPRRRQRPRGGGGSKGGSKAGQEDIVMTDDHVTGGSAEEGPPELAPDDWADDLPIVRRPVRRPPGATGGGDARSRPPAAGGKGKGKSKDKNTLDLPAGAPAAQGVNEAEAEPAAAGGAAAVATPGERSGERAALLAKLVASGMFGQSLLPTMQSLEIVALRHLVSQLPH